MAINVGITGGIGSGKSTVCRLFEVLGAPVYYADERAKALMVEDPELVTGLKKLFGPETYTEQGRLRTDYLASKVFGDPQALESLNSLVHPVVFRDSAQWLSERGHFPYTLREAALLYESGAYKLLDEIVVVWAPETLRLKRVNSRDGLSEEAIRERMKRQWPDEKKRDLADHIILNDGEHALIPQVIALHRDWTTRKQLSTQNGDSSKDRH